MPKLVLSRKNEVVNMTDPYVIYINGKKTAALSPGEKRVIKLKEGEVSLHATMDAGYASSPQKIEAKKGDTIKLTVSGFRYQAFILPYFVILISICVLLKESDASLLWFALPFLLPVAFYAAYHYVIRTDRYLRIDVKK